jgi:putative transposase
MRDAAVLLLHAFATIFRILLPAGVRSVVAESVLLKHQLLILNRRDRKRTDSVNDAWSLFVRPTRLARAAILLKPSTLLNFHRALVRRKYRLLFSPKRRVKPGPKGPDMDIIRAVVEMKQRKPTWGCHRIAAQINPAFRTCINKDVA